MRDGYRYPDADDRITLTAFEQVESSWNSEGASAERALALLSERLDALLPSRDNVKALDAGCGQGRLIPWLAQFSATITGVDVDMFRLEMARRCPSIAETALQFECSDIMGVNGKMFDLVICSHVIQHVPTLMLPQILTRLAELTSPSGLMVLAFSRSPVGGESFGLSYLEEGRACTAAISKDHFDEIAGLIDHHGSVPFRRIDLPILAGQAQEAGWRMLWKWNYHLPLTNHGVSCESLEDIYNHSDELESDCRGDIYTLWQKCAQSN